MGDVAVLAAERERAAQVKSTQPVTVVLGNPPYRRRTAQSGGGWVVHPAAGRVLFDDVTEPPRTAGVIFSAQASLFNDYVYFWRWAIHKAFEQTPDTPAVVSFITASSWLQGPAFLGLRTLARELADEVWVVDLGGEGRGGQLDDNVFAIQTPVAVVTLFRRATSTPTPATVHYRRVTGTRHAKLTALAAIHAPQTEPANPPPTGDPGDGWAVLPAAVGDRMVPISGGLDWQAMPALTDLFPWQQPGCKIGRTWPIAPTAELLRERWRAMLSRTDAAARAEAHVTPSSGRTIFTRVAGLKPIAELPADAPPRPIVRYGFRSFDRQWTPQDPRVAALERPALWAALSDHQIFLTTLTTSPLGRGPALTATTLVPDLHHFRGSFGGKDVIPLYRDATTTKPNVTAGLLQLLTERYGGNPVTPEDLTAYVFAVLAHPGYQSRFAVELTTPGSRVPLTADPDLFVEGRDLGRELLWLQTYADRYRTPAGRGTDLPSPAGLGWATPVDRIPSTDRDIRYNPQTKSLHIDSGTVTGVSPEVWTYEVSGLAVLPRWLASRTARGTGRAASRPTPLDRIRPQTWADEWNDELLDLVRVLTATVALQPRQDDLLARILDAPLLDADQVPAPTAAERKVPT